MANSDFPPSQVSVQKHSEHLKVGHRIHKLGVKSKDCQEHSHRQKKDLVTNLTTTFALLMNHYRPEKRQRYYKRRRSGIQRLLEGCCTANVSANPWTGCPHHAAGVELYSTVSVLSCLSYLFRKGRKFKMLYLAHVMKRLQNKEKKTLCSSTVYTVCNTVLV